MEKKLCAVTGATGHIGSALVRALLEKGYRVRVLVLPQDSLKALKGLNVEVCIGNVTDLQSLRQAFAGCEYVFHLAGIVSIGTGGKKRLQQINVEGTRNVTIACKSCGIKRLVYASSVHAIAEPKDGGQIIEPKSFSAKRVKGLYAKSKARATNVVLAAARNGLDAVVCHPSGVIGPYEYKLSNLGQLVVDFMKKRLLAYIDGAYNFVDVRDVADGMVYAAEKGRKGECYILSGEKVTVKELMDDLEEITSTAAPKTKMPYFLAKATAPMAELYYKLLKQQPLYTPYAIYTLHSNCNISCKKAKKELGYKPRPVYQSLKDSVEWFRQQQA